MNYRILPRALSLIGLSFSLVFACCILLLALLSAPVVGRSDTISLLDGVGSQAGICATETAITVPVQTPLHYCLTLTNHSNVTITQIDWQTARRMGNRTFGYIAQINDFALASGQVMTITANYPVTLTGDVLGPFILNDNVEDHVILTATAIGGVTQFTATANNRVYASVTGGPSIVVSKTVGTVENECAATAYLSVNAGTTIYYCIRVQNVGATEIYSYTIHDTTLGFLFGSEGIFSPGSIFTLTQQAVSQLKVPSASLDLTNTVLVTAAHSQGIVTNTAIAKLDVLFPGDPSPGPLTLHETVGLSPDVCASTSVITVPIGTEVYYCLTVGNNTGQVLVGYRWATRRQEVGQVNTIRSGFQPYPLQQGESLSITAKHPVTQPAFVLGPQKIRVDVTHNTVLTASNPSAYFSASTGSEVYVQMIGEPGVVATMTVGLTPNQCATTQTLLVSPGTPVYLCITIANSGATDLYRYTIRAQNLGFVFGVTRLFEPGTLLTLTNADLQALGPITVSAPLQSSLVVTASNGRKEVVTNTAANVQVQGVGTPGPTVTLTPPITGTPPISGTATATSTPTPARTPQVYMPVIRK